MSHGRHRNPGAYVLGAGALAIILWLAAISAGVDEGLCLGCHSTMRESSAVVAHTNARCSACHADAGAVAYWTGEVPRMVAASIVGSSAGPVAETRPGACLECHRDVMTGVSDGASGIRISHETCAVAASSCDSCHSTTAHGAEVRLERLPIMEECTACHVSQSASIACEACHVEDVEMTVRLESGPWQVTHGPNWRQTHGMGRIDSCVTCHPADYCVRCHGLELPHPASFGREHGQQSLADNATCDTCHASRGFCDSCHGIEMPHPATFLPEHSSIASDTTDPACTPCHAREDCDACHVRHIHPGGSQGVPVPQTGSGTGLESDR